MITCVSVYVSGHAYEGLYGRPCVLQGHCRILSMVWDSDAHDPRVCAWGCTPSGGVWLALVLVARRTMSIITKKRQQSGEGRNLPFLPSPVTTRTHSDRFGGAGI